MSSWQMVLAVLASILGVYGAVLSTYTFIVNRREKQPQIRVTVMSGFLARGAATSSQMLVITASNIGHRPVTLTTPDLVLPDGKSAFFFDYGCEHALPAALPEGQGCTVWVDIHRTARSLFAEGYRGKVKLRGRFTDAAGRTFVSKPYPLDVSAWAKDR